MTTTEELYTTVFNTVPFLIFQKDTKNNILCVNRAVADSLGIDQAEIENTSSAQWFPDDVDIYYADDLDVINNNKPKLGIIEPKVICGEKKWFQTDKFPTYSPDGSVSGVLVIAQDVTERQQFQEQLQHALRMDSIGRLAGGVAHDLNNLLTVIGCSTERAQFLWQAGEPIDDSLDLVLDGCTRAAHLTSQLLGFARKQRSRPEPADLNNLCLESKGMLRSLVSKDIEIVMSLKASRNALVDPAQMEQLLLNLVLNARDAIDEQGVITIGTRDSDLDAKDIGGNLDVTAGEYTALFVEDTGSGLSTDVAAKAFEPFFTTKGSDGSGLGLAVCFGIVMQHHGHITFDTKVGKGTTFHLYLPSTSACVEGKAPAVKKNEQGGHEKILIVEDEKLVRSMLSDALSNAGYSVSACSSAEEALSNSDNYDLLLTDVVLPGKNGQALANKLSDKGQIDRVLLISGYSDKYASFDSFPFLKKPFSLDELYAMVRKVLDTESIYIDTHINAHINE